MNYFPRKTYSKTANNDRSAEIKKFQDRKDKSISFHMDAKEVGIIATSSIQDAFNWCVNHPNWKSKMTDEERWEWINEVADKTLSFFAANKPELEKKYRQLREISKRAEEKALDDITFDFGEEEQ